MLKNLAGRMAVPRIAQILAVVGTVVAVYLHVLFGMNAGALWRDEVNSLEVATMRTFTEMWANLSFDSFPALFFLLLRLFAGVPASVSDASLRVFGAAIGLLILVAVWLNARWLRLGFPLITLALIGFNPMVIRYGDSIRAYGLGIFLALLTIGAMWRLIESFTLQRVLVAVVIAVLSVQSLYYNAVLFFALCLAAAIVTLRRRQVARTSGRSCHRRVPGGFIVALLAHHAARPIMQLHVERDVYDLRNVAKSGRDSRLAAPIRWVVMVTSADCGGGYRSLGSVLEAGDDRGTHE